MAELFGAGERREMLAQALAAAREAGALLLEHYGRIRLEDVRTKTAARDLVTAADVAAERIVVERLREAFPDHAIEAEEEVHDRSARETPRWFLDPLDGTVNFVHRLPFFAVSLALYSPEGPELAVVHAPELCETFTAMRGGGAYLGERKLSVSRAESLGESLLATGFPYRRNEVAENNLGNFSRFFLEVRGERRMGSAAIDLAYVADGRLDGYWELHLSPYDVAAGALLVREAGGIVTDADGGEDWLRGGHIVASAPGIHAAMRERVRH
jgi:myo-inositol-1(or 4)-monophosphatase